MAERVQCRENVERCDLGSGPCLGGTWSSATPQFMTMCPLAAIRRRAKITKRLPYGPLFKKKDTLCGWCPDTRWPEYLPWQKPQFWLDAAADAQSSERLGKFYWKSQFRSLDQCGCIATRKACECGNPYVNNCVAPCEKPACSVEPLAPREEAKELHFAEAECDLNCSGCVSESESVVSDSDSNFSVEDDHERFWQPKATLFGNCAPCNENACEGLMKKAQSKRKFRINQTLLATPSGVVKPISESMTGGRVYATGRGAHRNVTANRFQIQQKSYFSNYGVPGQFANSTMTRTRGAPDGTRWIGQAICSNVNQQPGSCCNGN